MKRLELNQMESIIAGDMRANIHGAACGLSLAWPIGTLIFGPTCLGLFFGE